jgi:hypothetical protein
MYTQGYSLYSITFFQIIKKLRGVGVEIVKKDNPLHIVLFRQNKNQLKNKIGLKMIFIILML